MVRMHFPGIRVYARATDRLHAYRLVEVGVNAVHREMFASSITLARDVFVGLGLPAHEAEQITRTFKEYDEKLVRAQYRMRGDQSAMTRPPHEAAAHLATPLPLAKDMLAQTQTP